MSAHDQFVSLVSKHKLIGKAKEKIDAYIDLLETKLNSLKELPPRNLDDHSILEDVKFPINDKSFKLDASFLFKPPELLKVGSYALNCSSRNEDNIFVIDLALEIPKECWQKKDYLNYVYHRKRAFYLAFVAKKLQSFKDIVGSVQFSFFHGDHLKPILVLTPAGKLQSICRFYILPFAAQDKSFVYQRFSLDKLNVQSSVFDETLGLLSSPIYNSSILKDSTLNDSSKLLSEILSDKPNVLDALVLLRLWLEKRSLQRQFAHILTAYVAYLLKKNIINPNLSGFQVFKSILQSLSTSSWDLTGIAYNSSDEEIDFDEEELCTLYRNYFQVVFLDVHSKINLCHSITIDLYKRLKYDAKIVSEQLNQHKVDLESIFSGSVDFNQYFDYYINVSTDCIKLNFLQNEPAFLDRGFNAVQVLCCKLLDLIELAVGDRISLIQHKDFAVHDSWNLSATAPYKSSAQFITFGLLIKNEKAFEAITKGPLANQPEAAAFRELWGEKSEIRRFQNGDICEAVYWGGTSPQEKRNIILEAIKYVFNRKLQCKLKLIASTFGYVDSLLELKSIRFDNETTVYGTGEHFLEVINQSMVTMKKYLHNLSGQLSFTVVDVVGVDPVLRSTEVFPPLPVNSSPKNVLNFCNSFDKGDFDDKLKYIKPIEIVVKIDADTKLLNNLEAMQNQKYHFHYELGKVMAKSYNLFVRPTPSYLDLFFNGYVFRVIITLSKEAAIHREMVNQAKAVKSVESVEADELEFQAQVLPALSSCLNTLSKENASFALTCRLFKRWLSLSMVKHFFADITLDLLVAYAYQHFDCQYPTPNSPVKGLLRVLKFISEFDFTANPLILNFNQTFSHDKLADIKESFTAERPRLPVLFIVTPYDRKLSQHTRCTPSALIVYHVKKRAKTLLSSLTVSLSQFKVTDIKNYLQPNLSMFDLVIRLNTRAILNKVQSLGFPATITIKQSLYSSEQKHVMPITDFNPARLYLNSLKAAFRNQALFFYDDFGGRHIGVLLRPETLETKPFKYSTVEGSMLTGTSYSHSIENVAFNLPAFLEDLQILGEGLVEKVSLQSDKLLSKAVL